MLRRFAGIDSKYANKDAAKIWLQSIPYDGTTTWGKGADAGFAAFLEAADNMELYDIETDSEVYMQGIHILDTIKRMRTPDQVFETVYKSTTELLKSDKFLTFFGGEHSISIGIIKAFYEKFEDLTVLQLDAHADLRPAYEGTIYNHACAVHDASQNCNLVQVGIRSMDESERGYIQPGNCFFAHEMAGDDRWMDEALNRLTGNVYITLDLDVLDPSIMPSTGTPEPGGLDWYSILKFLRKVFESCAVHGFDIVELAPIDNLHAPNFLAAKLYYKMLSYKFMHQNE